MVAALLMDFDRYGLSFGPARALMRTLSLDQPYWATIHRWCHSHQCPRFDSAHADCSRNDTLVRMVVVRLKDWPRQRPHVVAPRNTRNNHDKIFVHSHDSDVFVETK